MTTNVLIFDESEDVSYLLKSILLTQNYRVSLSKDLSDAEIKINTALFDLVLVCYHQSPETLKFLEDIARRFNFLPTVLITDAKNSAGDLQTKIPNLIILNTPIRYNALIETLNYVNHDARRLTMPYKSKDIEIPAEILLEANVIKCNTERLTPSSALLGNINTNPFCEIDKVNSLFETKLFLNDALPLTIMSKISFVERRAQKNPKQIAICFAEISQTARDIITKLVAA